MKKKGMSVKFITQAAVIAAIYVVLVVIFNYISFGPVQFRIAEALTILPYFTPAAIPGLFVGCIILHIFIYQKTIDKPFLMCICTSDNYLPAVHS